MKALLVILVAFSLSGCATVDPSLQMSKDTRIYILDTSKDVLFSTSVANDSNAVMAITRRIISDTADKLKKDNVTVTNDLIAESANLKYEIKTISGSQSLIAAGNALLGRSKIEIKYRATLEDSNGKKLFVYDDEQDDSNIDDVCDKVAGKVANRVLRYYKE